MTVPLPPRRSHETALAKTHPLVVHLEALLACRRCSEVVPPVVTGCAVETEIFFIGQAPGVHEGTIGQPFAWTAGKTLFRWLATVGVSEEVFRERVYMTAVIRCFPGKAQGGGKSGGKSGGKGGGGDRVPSRAEIETCGAWMRDEVQLLRPRLVLAIGRLAIERVAGRKIGKLDEAVGPLQHGVFFGQPIDWIAFPHPSGLSSWHKTEPGKTLLAQALATFASHPSFARTFGERR